MSPGAPPTYEDDPTIDDATELWRRIPPTWHKFDKRLGRHRPSTQAFRDSRDGTPMSVYLGPECGGDERVLAGHEGFLLGYFTAGLAREWSQRVTREPRLETEPGHAWVAGKKTDAVRSALARGSGWIVGP